MTHSENKLHGACSVFWPLLHAYIVHSGIFHEFLHHLRVTYIIHGKITCPMAQKSCYIYTFILFFHEMSVKFLKTSLVNAIAVHSQKVWVFNTSRKLRLLLSKWGILTRILQKGASSSGFFPSILYFPFFLCVYETKLWCSQKKIVGGLMFVAAGNYFCVFRPKKYYIASSRSQGL